MTGPAMPDPAKTGVVTQARTTSTRLPGKVLIEVGGRTLLEHHLDRLEATERPVYIATTTNATDDPIVEIAERRGVPVHRGSEDDVLGRFAGLVEEFELETVVRVTSDCPLIDGRVIRDAILVYEGLDPWLYASNGLERTFPRGMDFELFSGEALLDAAAHATEPHQREHVTPYLYENVSGRMTIADVVQEPDASAHRLTLDTPDDLVLIRTLIEQYGAADLSVDELVSLLDQHPELPAINAHVEQKKLGQ